MADAYEEDASSRILWSLLPAAERPAPGDRSFPTEEANDALVGSLSLLSATLDSTPDGIVAVRLDGRITAYNRRFLEMWGVSAEMMLTRTYDETAAYIAARVKNPQRYIEAARAIRDPDVNGHRSVHALKDGRTLERFLYPQTMDGVRIGSVITWRDATRRAKAEDFAKAVNDISEMMIGAEPVERVAKELIALTEDQIPGALGSLVLLDASGTTIERSISPNLPQAYGDALIGVVIGPAVGSCGTAAYLKRRVITPSIPDDPAWTPYAALARDLGGGLVACCSSPVLARDGRAFGSFATYFKERHTPDDGELAILDTVSHLLSLAVAREEREEAIHDHVERQDAIARFGEFAIDAPDSESLYRGAVEALCRGMRVAHCRLLRFGADRATLIGAHGAGWHSTLAAGRAQSVAGDHVATVLASREAIVIEDLAKETRFEPDAMLVDAAVVSGIETRVLIGGAPVGILGVYGTRPRQFQDGAVNFVQSIANIVGVALERREAEKRLAHRALHDALCDLPNRLLMKERLGIAFAQAARSKRRVAVMFIDLDRFKSVNDSLGHDLGDQLLREASRRLLSRVRTVDTVSRHGGDEFTVILPEIDHEEAAARIAQQFIDALSEPYRLQQHEVLISATVGIAFYPDNGVDADTVVRNADAAMYVGKEHGRNRYQFYSTEMNARAHERLSLEADLHRALARDELRVHYQPQVDLETGAVIGIEALARWSHPRRGNVPPGIFIPIAEQTGLISAIGSWVLATASAQHARWVADGLPVGRIAVNVSAPQFHQPAFVAMIRHSLAAADLDPSRLELEVTESVVMQGADLVERKLVELSQLGVKLSIDDFGTGYSSLGYLKRFPIDRLKIDRTFTSGVPHDSSSCAIAHAIVGMGRSLKLEVLAEGVETEVQADWLRSIGCETAQGYLFARPMPADECVKFLKERVAG